MLVKGPPVASFTKEVNPWLAKRPLVFNGRLANGRLTSLVKEATGGHLYQDSWSKFIESSINSVIFQLTFC